MRKPITTLSLLIALCGCGLLSGCASVGTPRAGAVCSVQFRRDALGANRNLPISPMTDRIDGAEVSVTGKFKSMSEDWIVVQDNTGDIWIPRGMVLLFKVFPQ